MIEVDIGRVFGAWKVKEKLSYGQKYKCECMSCGEVKNIRVYDLLKGKTTMCRGCATSLASSSGRNTNTDLTYNTYIHMLQRCYNPDNKDYVNYGGRGIQVCELWKDSYDAFLLQMGPKPKGYTIERINHNGNYEPSNCKWIPRSDQPLNKRDNVTVTAFGDTKLVSQWSRDPRCVVPKTTLYRRIKDGWDPERAITEPSK